MRAAGIDLGGTKIEAQVFDGGWAQVARQRWETPKDYAALVAAMAEAVAWCGAQGAGPVGVAAAGLVNPGTGLALTANLPATGRPFPADVAAAAGPPGGLDQRLPGAGAVGGDVRCGQGRGPGGGADPGHGRGGRRGDGGAADALTRGGGRRVRAFPAGGGADGGAWVARARLRLRAARLCRDLCLGPRSGADRGLRHGAGSDAEAVVAGRGADAGLARAWDLWLDLAAEFLVTLCFTLDPEVIVLGGGLSRAPGLAPDLSARLAGATLAGFPIPAIRLAEGGDASGARGAALHAAGGGHG